MAGVHQHSPSPQLDAGIMVGMTRYSLLTVAALMLLVLLVIFTLLGEDLLLGAARSVSLLPDQVEHSLSHPRVLGEHQL